MGFKRTFAVLAAVMGIGAAFSLSAYAENDVITVKVDNEEIVFDQHPIIVDPGYTMVPIRAVFEKAGASVSWNQSEQTAVIAKDAYEVSIKYGDNVMYKNGTEVALDAPAIIEDGRMMIPVRAIAEAMDFSVTWDGHHSMVLVSTDGKPYRPYAFLKLGFKTLQDASEFYMDAAGSSDCDLDGDGREEHIEFAPVEDLSVQKDGALIIDGEDYTNQLGSLSSIQSVALVDTAAGDGAKELVVTENGDTLTAYFYRYNNGILTQLTVDGDPGYAGIPYASRLLFSGKGTTGDMNNGRNVGYILSDVMGTCFVDIMVTSGIYLFDNDTIQLKPMSKISPIFNRNLYKTYDDSMLYHIIYTNDYVPGRYKDVTDTGVINANELSQFKVINGYGDDSDKRYIELYIELLDGTRAVIKPYNI